MATLLRRHGNVVTPAWQPTKCLAETEKRRIKTNTCLIGLDIFLKYSVLFICVSPLCFLYPFSRVIRFSTRCLFHFLHPFCACSSYAARGCWGIRTNPAFLGPMWRTRKAGWGCKKWRCVDLLHVNTGAPGEQRLESAGHGLVRGVCAISLRIGQRVEG